MASNRATYLDYNAAAPLLDSVQEVLQVFINPKERLGGLNPSSLHSFGRRAKALLAEAREKVARSLGVRGYGHVFFTSSGTEASQWVIRSVLEQKLAERKSVIWISSRVEREATRGLIAEYRARGVQIIELEVDSSGLIKKEEWQKALTADCALLSLIWVNNETGVIQPVQEIIARAQKLKIPVHLDAAQAWGKIPVDLKALGADFVSFSGLKIGALPGSGVLWTSPRQSSLRALIPGKQEWGNRGGTENLLSAVALGAAASAIQVERFESHCRELYRELSQELERTLGQELKIPYRVHGVQAPRVSNTLSLCIPGHQAETLAQALDLAGFAVSTGPACSSGTQEPSWVLQWMGVSKEDALSTLRISWGLGTELSEIQAFARELGQILLRT